jgi:hypothetical protein
VFGVLARQREATVVVAVVLPLLRHQYNSTFVSQTNLSNLPSNTAAPIIITRSARCSC